ncbi:CD99 molecule isoform X3 [Nerophis lumbriciformis]|uniref:CD99 molecule isoform X3 n=1 Tax=Nerophis lumbriciformis TaxID=546530 RepID=UPI002ADF895F|nr:CD99 molecule isoform X3 [Nerophis lumbriciformis]
MKFVLSACLLFLLAKGTFTQEGFDLSDALDDVEPTPPKAEAPANPKDDDGFDLFDALGPDPNEKPDKPAIKPPKPGGGGGSSFDDKDLYDLGGGEYKPEGGGGRADQPYDTGDQPQEAGSGAIAGIASAIGVAILGAASSYFAYQKKKLCFKIQGGADPERGKGHHGTQSNPQVFSNLLNTS